MVLMEDLDHQQLILLKHTHNFVWIYIIMLIIVISSLREKKSSNLKPTKKFNVFPTQFCLGSMSNGFSAAESRKVSLNGSVYNFSVDYNFFDKSDILNI